MFADNKCISVRQFQRQLVLTFMGVLLLFLPGGERLNGSEGLAAIFLTWLLLCVYGVYLVRLGTVYTKPVRNLGLGLSRGMGILYLIYLLTSGAYLTAGLMTVIEKYLVPQIPVSLIAALLLCACLTGKAGDIERRGRMAELCYPILLAGVVGLLIWWGKDVERVYAVSMPQDWDWRAIGTAVYALFGTLIGISMIPFCIGVVQKPAARYGGVFRGITILCALLFASSYVLQAAFGTQGQIRYGLFSMALLLFFMLFTLKSIFFYCNRIMAKTRIRLRNIWCVLIVYLLAVAEIKGVTIMEIYEKYLLRIYVPVFLFLSLALGIVIAVTGCGGTEPEKRALPLAAGIDYTEGMYCVFYAMPDLAQETGQKKEESGQERSWVQRGLSMETIHRTLQTEREETLDLGHVEVLVLGKSLLQNQERTGEVIAFLQTETTLQEDMPVVMAETLDPFIAENDATSDSIGKRLRGILEKQETETGTLRQMYRSWGNERKLPDLIGIRLEGQKIKVYPE